MISLKQQAKIYDLNMKFNRLFGSSEFKTLAISKLKYINGLLTLDAFYDETIDTIGIRCVFKDFGYYSGSTYNGTDYFDSGDQQIIGIAPDEAKTLCFNYLKKKNPDLYTELRN